MGSRHVRPFKNTLIDVEKHNLVVPYKRVGHQVAVVDVDEGVLEGSDMSGTHLNGFLVKN